jgi:PDZ domain-containing protein
MTQRTLAGLLAVPLLIGLWTAAATEPLPYVTYEPGLTVDVLAEAKGEEIVEVQGHETYRDAGELRMTTVYVSQPDARVNLFELMHGWISREDSVYPYKSVYRPDETTEDNRREGAVEMVSSQDAAIAAALKELGIDVEPALEVLSVSDGAPADGRLEVRDIFMSVDGHRVTRPDDVIEAVRGASAGQPVTFVVRRDGQRRTVAVTPEQEDGRPQVGIQLGTGYEFPFKVSVNIDSSIGGPSAGLMFSLGIYDTLTPGSLTGGEVVAGTGTIDGSGKVGPIGGIQQKIVGARDAGARLFLVPPDNCQDAAGAPAEDMRLVKAETMHDAVAAIQTWVADHDADLPTCEEDS